MNRALFYDVFELPENETETALNIVPFATSVRGRENFPLLGTITCATLRARLGSGTIGDYLHGLGEFEGWEIFAEDGACRARLLADGLQGTPNQILVFVPVRSVGRALSCATAEPFFELLCRECSGVFLSSFWEGPSAYLLRFRGKTVMHSGSEKVVRWLETQWKLRGALDVTVERGSERLPASCGEGLEARFDDWGFP